VIYIVLYVVAQRIIRRLLKILLKKYLPNKSAKYYGLPDGLWSLAIEYLIDELHDNPRKYKIKMSDQDYRILIKSIGKKSSHGWLNKLLVVTPEKI